jgi:tricorn protease-like protein
MDHICRGAHLVLDQGRSIRVWRNGRSAKKAIESFAAQHQSVISPMPVEGRVYFVRDPTASAGYSTGDAGARVERQSC